MWEELGKIMALAGKEVIFSEARLGTSGAEKHEVATTAILKEISDPGGIEITNPWVLKLLRPIVSACITYAVFRCNQMGFFGSSSTK